MKVMRLAVASAVAGGLSVAAGGPVAANVVWCVSDPPVSVQTEDGTKLTVNTTVYLDKASAGVKNEVEETATAVPDAAGGTLITVQVYVPEGVTSARAVASINKYKISASGTGTGGDVITLYLDAPAS